MTLTDWKDVATIAGITISVLAYLTNSYFQIRTMRIENLKRYFEAHDRLFEEGSFIVTNIKEFEADTYKRDATNQEMEKKFNRFLGNVEKIAYLTSHGAVPTTVQVYMFGWFAQKVHPHLTESERNNVFWELAIHYVDELRKAADDYLKLPNRKREKYLKKNALVYKKYS
jgi:hypothetical protein